MAGDRQTEEETRPGATLIQRHLARRTREALRVSRVVNIVGPRQAGKSTLVEHQVPVAHYLTLDDDAFREAVKADPHTVRAIA